MMVVVGCINELVEIVNTKSNVRSCVGEVDQESYEFAIGRGFFIIERNSFSSGKSRGMCHGSGHKGANLHVLS